MLPLPEYFQPYDGLTASSLIPITIIETEEFHKSCGIIYNAILPQAHQTVFSEERYCQISN